MGASNIYEALLKAGPNLDMESFVDFALRENSQYWDMKIDFAEFRNLFRISSGLIERSKARRIRLAEQQSKVEKVLLVFFCTGI